MCLLLLPAFSLAQQINSEEAYLKLKDSLWANLQCTGPGFINTASGTFKLPQNICCAYHVKEAYNSLIALQERLSEAEIESPTTPPGKNETYCEQLKKCNHTIYEQKRPLIEKAWKEYNDGLKKSGAEFDSAYNPTVELLKAQCYLKWNPATGVTRQPNPYAPRLIVLKLINYKNCLQLAIKLTNTLQKIYGDMEETCNKRVMGNSLLAPLCENISWDPTDLYATIAELYELIKYTEAKECGQPLKVADCCTVIPYKH